MKPSDDLIVSSTEPTGLNRKKVWIQKGKNLASIPEFKVAGGVGTTYRKTIEKVMPNTNYILSFIKTRITDVTINNKALYGWSYIYFYNDDTKLSQVSSSDVSNNFLSGSEYYKKVITTPANCNTIVVCFDNNNGDENTNTLVSEIQLEQGSIPTEYEEYIEPKIYIRNDNNVYEEFRKIDRILDSTSTNAIENQAVYNAIKNRYGYNGFIGDLNDANITGTYSFNLGSSNKPFDGYGSVLVFVGGNFVFDSTAWWIHHLVFGTDGSVWTRFKITNVDWSEWKQLA